MSFFIVTDTSANLPTELLVKYGIPAVPFSYCRDGVSSVCEDTRTFDGAAYYGAMRAGERITTSQINPQKYLDAFEPILQAGNDLLYVGMSSGISGSFHWANVAAAQLRLDYPQRQIELVDTRTASLGEGIPVLKAEEFRQAGLSLAETAERLRAFCETMYSVFIVDDLMHLRRTGRLSGAIALVGTVLQIKPMLKGNEEGKIVNFAKIRGRRKAVEALAEKYDTLAAAPEEQIVGIAHADCPEDAALLADLLRKNRPPKEILTVCYEPVTGSHVGPGTLALFFEGGPGVRGK